MGTLKLRICDFKICVAYWNYFPLWYHNWQKSISSNSLVWYLDFLSGHSTKAASLDVWNIFVETLSGDG